MKPPTLREKLLGFYAERDRTGNEDMKRCVETYLHAKYTDAKILRVIDGIKDKHDLKQESEKLKCKVKLLGYIDSIVEGRIRDSAKNSIPLDINALDEHKFKALIKQVLLHFGYAILFIPVSSSGNNLDFIAHRKESKIAVFTAKNPQGCLVGVKAIRQARFVANHYSCEQAIFITNTFFHEEADNEAANLEIALLDGNKLLPLIQDLIDNRQREEKELILNRFEEDRSAIFLEGNIKFPKTKVQVVFIRYYIDSESNVLIFEGKLFNTGKKPVSNISAGIKIFNRNGDCVFIKSFPIEIERLESKEETEFKFRLNEMSESDWKNICRYELKLEYNNIYRE